MSPSIDKPYVLRVAELIYFKVFKIKEENPEMSNLQAFEVFMTTKDYNLISSGEFHDQWFLELKNNNFIDKITGKKINGETLIEHLIKRYKIRLSFRKKFNKI